jgi:hypothetical protein
MNARRPLAVLLVVGLVLSGCASFSSWVRQYTYPPDFRYITREQLRSSMWQLARHVRELDRTIRAPERGEQQRGEILEHLRAMEQAADSLNRTGWPSNHPLIDMNLTSFRRDIGLARDAVERDPPNYVLAGSLSGACVYCHRGR